MNARRGIVWRTVVIAVVGLVTISPLYWMLAVAFSTRAELLGAGRCGCGRAR
ncbi:hypothetical protein [Litorihabitans aurantiacus]|uniref:Uncharacterized protein n=1 Tax=Litorihabitans aurantiacus TaxID=1930061 RepID=A0AA37UKW3_9MICO|nr:hypothetical protein [Litorihabitans aurantiacus]GMA30034.1 hypothetical protein GCM10025875_00260 [Litorihabitans aurantiacus]